MRDGVRRCLAAMLGLVCVPHSGTALAGKTHPAVWRMDLAPVADDTLPASCRDPRTGIGVHLLGPQGGPVADPSAAGPVGSSGMATFELGFALPRPDRVREVVLELPEGIPDRTSFALSCLPRSGDAPLVFRPRAPRIRTSEYEEPLVHALPAACIRDRAALTVSVSDWPVAADEGQAASPGPRSAAPETVLGKAGIRVLEADPTRRNAYFRSADLYLTRMSYRVGEEIELHVHSRSPRFQLAVYRSGARREAMLRRELGNGMPQKTGAMDFRDGAGWPVTNRFMVPPAWTSGYYVAVVSNAKGSSTFPFVVSPARGDSTQVAVIASTNTWQAYNNWGGASFYYHAVGTRCLGLRRSTVVSTQRPVHRYPRAFERSQAAEHLFPADREITAWLEREGVAFALYSDDDLHSDPSLLAGHPVVILGAHPEYYSDAMVRNLEHHLAGGGSLLYLGGNGIYVRTTVTPTHIESHLNSRIHDLDGEAGGFFGALGRSQASILGIAYDARGYDTHAPYLVLRPEHPLLSGTGLREGETFGAGASGHETDKIGGASPPGLVHLAKGTNPSGGGADMVLYDHPAGGLVFSVGSLTYSRHLASDRQVRTITRNALREALGRSRGPRRPATLR